MLYEVITNWSPIGNSRLDGKITGISLISNISPCSTVQNYTDFRIVTGRIPVFDKTGILNAPNGKQSTVLTITTGNLAAPSIEDRNNFV